MSNLILVSHGNLCTELKKSVEMIMGPQETVHSVPLLPEEGEVEFLEKFESICQSIDNYTVFADLLGGTPCNILTKKLIAGENFGLYTGMNLPMVISFINANLLGIEANFMVEAIESIVNVNDQLEFADFDEEDE